MQKDRVEFPDLYVGLLHYPVYDKNGRVISTAVTNLDIHDLARCASTFGIRNAYIINPLDSQRELAGRIIRHWTTGVGAQYNPVRKEALHRVRVRATLGEARQEISETHRFPVRTIATGAVRRNGAVSYSKMRDLLRGSPRPHLIIFGTGWGLAEEILEECDCILAPIEGVHDYNHLSVRSAAAIILDRLMGNR